MPLPNLQPADFERVDRTPVIPAVGYGPLAPTWPDRVRRLGKHAPTWNAARWHESPLPADVDPAYFQVAPSDQQIKLLRDDEPITLENLVSGVTRLSTKLPGIFPRTLVERGGAARELLLRADTLWIDTDKEVCTLTWRGQVALDGPDEEGRILVAMQRAGEELSWPVIYALAAAQGHAAADDDDESPTAISSPNPDQKALTQTALIAPRKEATLPFLDAVDLSTGAFPAPWRETNPAEDCALPFGNADPLGAGRTPNPGDDLPVQAVDAQHPPRPAPVAAILPPDPVAAAAPFVRAPNPLSEPAATPHQAPAAPAAKRERKAPPPPLRLLWFEVQAVARLREHESWQILLAERDLDALDAELDRRRTGGDDSAMSSDDDGRGDVATILARGTPLVAAEVAEASVAATSDDGRFDPPLVLLAGELQLAFDERAQLQAALGAAAPFVEADKGLRAAVTEVNGVLDAAGTAAGVSMLDALTVRLSDALRKVQA